ncbi:metalloregulator ArsR/SmtB family transcription factor [Hyphomonas sp.]|uniref:ArsR/SmtB family transcription factor n=1 Tax=Hyphomonas sp. TaxID=87 RepID=UPI0032EBFB48|tara:strand:+ start:4336 stop:4794 length:459 start_codon:yes stop_codon:yes gene_type:complete
MMNSLLDADIFKDKAEEAASLLRSMANPHRLMILCRLGDTEISVGDLRQGTALSQSSLSQHLGVLRQEGLVRTRREGQSIFYSIADPAAIRVIATLATIYCPELLVQARAASESKDCLAVCPFALDGDAPGETRPGRKAPAPWARPAKRAGQ